MGSRRKLKNVFYDLMAMARHPWMLAIRPLLRKRSFGLVTLSFAAYAAVTGVVHSAFEDQSLGEGLWWALVTLTTVGYGDVGSVTTGGRMTGAALMIVGIGVLAFITASVAAFFVERDYKKELHEEVQSVNQRLDATNERLDRIEKLLSSGASPTVAADPDD